MRRATVLEHDVVRDVDQRGDRTLAAAREPVDHPGRRLRGGVDVAHDAAREAPAQVRRLHLHAQLAIVLHRCRRERGGLQRRAGERRHLARDAVHAEAMAKVGRELQREQRVVERQVGADVLAHRRGGGQHQQARMVVGELQLARRAQHALALDAAQQTLLDDERLAVLARRELGTGQRRGHLACLAAHDVPRAPATAGAGRGARWGHTEPGRAAISMPRPRTLRGGGP